MHRGSTAPALIRRAIDAAATFDEWEGTLSRWLTGREVDGVERRLTQARFHLTRT
jgi:hypothetical protein